MNLYEVVFWGRAGKPNEEDTIYLVRADKLSDAIQLVVNFAERKDHGRDKYSLPDIVYEIGRDLSLSLDKFPRILLGPSFAYAYNFGWRSWDRSAEDGTDTNVWREIKASAQPPSEQSATEGIQPGNES